MRRPLPRVGDDHSQVGHQLQGGLPGELRSPEAILPGSDIVSRGLGEVCIGQVGLDESCSREIAPPKVRTREVDPDKGGFVDPAFEEGSVRHLAVGEGRMAQIAFVEGKRETEGSNGREIHSHEFAARESDAAQTGFVESDHGQIAGLEGAVLEDRTDPSALG